MSGIKVHFQSGILENISGKPPKNIAPHPELRLLHNGRHLEPREHRQRSLKNEIGKSAQGVKGAAPEIDSLRSSRKQPVDQANVGFKVLLGIPAERGFRLMAELGPDGIKKAVMVGKEAAAQFLKALFRSLQKRNKKL